ncbi:plasma kallikrein-like, partial [Diadema antillarum]|uniref:plasma kallikrein-like n=1 Tax=Diadema antillarum TaxID=105358 RepID=UPI003A837A6E
MSSEGESRRMQSVRNRFDECPTYPSPWQLHKLAWSPAKPVFHEHHSGSGPMRECGYRPASSATSSRIIGGSDSTLGDWPWMVSLRDASNNHRCAAVLIDSMTAVTAAHCVDKFETAVLGDLKLSMTSKYHVEIDVESYSHPDYKPNQIFNDIAVIHFKTALSFDHDYILPVCLAAHENSTAYTSCYITGWGHTSEGGHVSDTLQKATVELFDQSQCESFYSDRVILPSMLCAGHVSGAMDSCQGDTGGPLVCEDYDGRFHLVGITSFGYGC